MTELTRRRLLAAAASVRPASASAARPDIWSAKADTRKLAQEIDALAEELSQVPAQIVG